MSLTETEIDEGFIPGPGAYMSVSNEDLRNEITRLTEQVRALTQAVKSLTAAGAEGVNERRSEGNRVTALYAGLSVLRWAMGLVSAGFAFACVWTFNNVTEATNTNRTQEMVITSMQRENSVRDTRIQALERGQFATTMKERP